MIDECRAEHCERIDCWIDGGGLPPLPRSSLLLLGLSLEDDDGCFDQLHVDEHLKD
jgi:hypothetical protein